MERIFRTLWQAGIARSDLYLAWDFTVASERNLTERMLLIRDDAFRQLGDNDLARPAGRRAARPTFTVTSVRTSSRAATTAARTGEDDRARPPRRGHVHGALLPRPAGLPAGVALQLRAPGGPHPARRSRATRSAPDFICNIPRAAVDGPTSAGAAVALRPRPARRPGRGERRQRQDDVQRARLRVLRHRRGSACPTRTSANVGRHPPGLRRTSRRWPTGCSRASSTSLFLGRLMIHPDGFASNAAFRWASGRRCSTPAPLLRRQQPGRHPRRRARPRSRPTSRAPCSACPA